MKRDILERVIKLGISRLGDIIQPDIKDSSVHFYTGQYPSSFTIRSGLAKLFCAPPGSIDLCYSSVLRVLLQSAAYSDRAHSSLLYRPHSRVVFRARPNYTTNNLFSRKIRLRPSASAIVLCYFVQHAAQEQTQNTTLARKQWAKENWKNYYVMNDVFLNDCLNGCISQVLYRAIFNALLQYISLCLAPVSKIALLHRAIKSQ